MVTFALFCVVAFLSLSPIAVVLSRSPRASGVVYASCLIITLTLAVVGGMCLIGQPTSRITLPLGLPWLGAHFRVDALSAFFLIVVNLGGAAASLFALGYGQHEHAPERVLPFYPAYLAGMNVVILADDAFSFLVAWEFMSLTSWALVVAHHRERENFQAGYIYLLMAGFGTLALLSGVRSARRRITATISSNRFVPRQPSRQRWRRSSLSWLSSAPDPRRVLFLFMPGCRSLIRPLPVTSPP